LFINFSGCRVHPLKRNLKKQNLVLKDSLAYKYCEFCRNRLQLNHKNMTYFTTKFSVIFFNIKIIFTEESNKKETKNYLIFFIELQIVLFKK
jgi:hypothetical protein